MFNLGFSPPILNWAKRGFDFERVSVFRDLLGVRPQGYEHGHHAWAGAWAGAWAQDMVVRHGHEHEV